MKRKATSDSNYQRINPTRVTENQPTAIGSRNRNVNISCEPIVVDYNHSPQGFDAHLFRNEMDMDTHRLAPDEFEGVSSKQNVSNINNDQDAEFENDELLVKEENYRVLWRTVNPYYYKQDLIEVQNYSGCICKCTTNKKGLLHYKYVGEQSDHPTVIRKNNNEYVFEGFSILSHYPLENIPAYTLQDLELFQEFLFDHLLELPDWSLKDPNGDGRLFYFIPLFVRKSHEKSVETLSVAEVLEYILNFSQPLFDKPSTIRVDDIDWSKVCYESRSLAKKWKAGQRTDAKS
ncbi:uncharacterized protein TRIADDRAFT_53287 [Trichoplax adhaerens]|uniref:Uncharacterized protein n=1 Tax=Trichoplax adhaerens TaxID=10228 RepID=B3RNU2_TRIAD|nr:predicted protein [Trichoplax adhaerens]EDV28070.1 predicted protein [Trichoplax adhaerens]|eukprot:XP_002109904.1 predicted protein [Trichoplax adhaerens]